MPTVNSPGPLRPPLKPPPPKPTFIPTPNSGNIKGFLYAPETRTVSVYFHSRPQLPYVHTNVPKDVIDGWNKWNEAGYSPGKFYHSHIRRYPLRSVDPATGT